MNLSKFYCFLNINQGIILVETLNYVSTHSNVQLLAVVRECEQWFFLSGVVFLDIRKTFDSIDHAIILKDE